MFCNFEINRSLDNKLGIPKDIERQPNQFTSSTSQKQAYRNK